MRLAVLANSETDFVWDPTSQYKLRGAIWSALDGTTYEKLHEQSDTPTFTFSNIFPAKGYTEINETVPEDTPVMFLISSPHPSLLDTVAADFATREDLEIGDIALSLDRVETRDIDVGRVGEKGTLKTQTGLYIRLPPEEQDRFDIDTPYEEATISWTPDHGMEPFKTRLMENITWKLRTLDPTIQQTPDSFQQLFDSVTIETTFETNVNVTEDYAYSFIPSVCTFGYTVTSQKHRKWLNTLLDTGLGWRNALGFGFINKTNKF